MSSAHGRFRFMCLSPGRKQAVENSNKEVVRNFHRQVHDRMEEMLGRLDAFRLVHHHANQSQKVLHERMRCDEVRRWRRSLIWRPFFVRM